MTTYSNNFVGADPYGIPNGNDAAPPYETVISEKGMLNQGFIPDEKNGQVFVSEVDLDLKKETGVKIEEVMEEDPWKISEVYIELVPWKELSTFGKVKRVLWDYLGKIVCFLFFLYMFICSLDFLSNAFRLVGGRTAGSVFSDSEVLSNPLAGLMIGVLATVLLQSSSTTTSIVVSMVAADIIPVQNAIPIIMGSNIGTSVTNTLVSMGQITNRNDFRRAFAGATVHDMFNWLTVIILLPLEATTGYLYRLSTAIIDNLDLKTDESADQEFLKVITEPFTKLIIQVDKKVIEDIAHGRPEAMNKSMIKHCCLYEEVAVEKWNTSSDWNFSYTEDTKVCVEKCRYLFENVANTWSDSTVGIVLLVIALVILCACLVLIVKTLNSLLKGKISLIIKKFVNAEFPGVFAYFTGYLALIIGTGLTILVQSSSILTSALTPLVGIGVIEIDRMYPLTLGANIGTTTTAILASFAQSRDGIPLALQIALCHLFFNISGILIFYPIPAMRFPIRMSKFLGNQTAKYRWFALVYLLTFFFLLPLVVFGLSMVSWQVMVGVLSPFALLVLFIVIVSILQKKAPHVLPVVLRDWKFLPEPLRSLEPYDRMISKLKVCCPCKNDPEEGETKTNDIQQTKL